MKVKKWKTAQFSVIIVINQHHHHTHHTHQNEIKVLPMAHLSIVMFNQLPVYVCPASIRWTIAVKTITTITTITINTIITIVVTITIATTMTFRNRV